MQGLFCEPRIMATTQLRRSFRYPTEDSDDNDTPNDLDEEGKRRSYISLIISNVLHRTGEFHQETSRGRQKPK